MSDTDRESPGVVAVLHAAGGGPLTAKEIAKIGRASISATTRGLLQEEDHLRVRRVMGGAESRWHLAEDWDEQPAPPQEPAEPKATTFRLDPDIRERLDAYCAAERRTLNGAVNYLILRGLDAAERSPEETA